MISKRIIEYQKKEFNSICRSSKKIKNLKNLIVKEKKIVVFKKVIDLNILKDISKTKANILRRKPFFFKTFLGSKDLFIFNKLNPKSTVKGYFRKIELYPWNYKNKKIYLNLKNVIKLKCLMENLQFKNTSSKKFFDKKKFLKIQLTNYPPKKGFLTKHVDGIYQTIVVIQLGISLTSQSDKNSGLFFYFDNEVINMDKYIGAGDIAIYNPIVPHEVKASKTGRGRWSALISSGHFTKLKGTEPQSRQINS